ncbi:MAG: ribonuclease III [Campylobacteraceae bacterium]|jgi:ribonuclease-3|nr:ribonuclease III [Campylobacteraceae bacterium]
MKENIERLEQRLGYQFKDKQLITQALTHKSCKKTKNNERLEFLGDAVLDLIVGEYLYMKFPTKPEGELSKLRASLVNDKSFKNIAQELNLGKSILISAAEEHNDGRSKESLLSNAFEAVIGAVYLDGGLQNAKAAAIPLFEKVYPKIDMQTLFKDYKTLLQEFTQAHFGVTPDYTLVHSSGPDHKKEFEMAVMLRGKVLAKARGNTKKEAEQIAAKNAFEILEKEAHE